jgi:hypothetical protein
MRNDGDDVYQFLSRDETLERVNVSGALGRLRARSVLRCTEGYMALRGCPPYPAGMSENDARSELQEEEAATEVIYGIRSLHGRIDELQRLVALRLETESTHAGEWLSARAGGVRPALPAWCRITRGELRWPVAITTTVGIALQVAVPDKLVLIHPSWIFPAAQGALLIVLVGVNPHRIDRQSTVMRSLSLMLAAMLSLANGWSVARLAAGITQGTMGQKAGQLLITGGVIWLTNVIAFGLWYWEFDRGGPVARALNLKGRYPDFQFPQMTSPDMAPPDWEPAFIDYLYVAFTNATAFSPTDTMPMSRWAKIAMTVQSIISIVTVALVVSRAVNILPS